MPSWVAVQMNITLEAHSDPQLLRRMEISDHSPVSGVFSKRRPAPANKRTIPNTILKHPAFKRLHDVRRKHFQLEIMVVGGKVSKFTSASCGRWPEETKRNDSRYC